MGRLRIARRELAALRSEKTIVLALLIQVFIAGFSSFLLVGLVSLYDPGAVSGGGVTMGVSGDASDELIEAVSGEGSWSLVEYRTESAAREAFRAGRLDAVLATERRASGVVAVQAVVPRGSVRSTVIVVQVREALTVYERARRAALSSRLARQPAPVPDVPDAAPTIAFTYTVLLPLLAFLPTFISGSIAADTITEELDAGTLTLLRTTPLSGAAILDGKMLAAIGLAPAQAAAWLALLWANGTAIAHPASILAFVTGIATVLVALGAGLAVWLGDRQSAQLLYSLGVLAAFVAATLLPESPPNVVAKLAIGSPTAATYVIALGSLVAAGAAYGAARLVATGRLAG